MWNYLLIISQNLKYEKHKDKLYCIDVSYLKSIEIHFITLHFILSNLQIFAIGFIVTILIKYNYSIITSIFLYLKPNGSIY